MLQTKISLVNLETCFLNNFVGSEKKELFQNQNLYLKKLTK